jgi:hypothetical protein
MSMLFRVIYAWQCKGTHHKLAMDALRLLDANEADRWRDLFLSQSQRYLQGSKAPDDQFKDFRNHVLHVADKGWGGAIDACGQWYQKTVDALQQQNWSEAAFAAGVLSHYVTDLLMPLHTGQSEAENQIHRACEWSVSQSYDDLMRGPESKGLTIHLSGDANWLRTLITDNARLAHAEYDRVVQDYDFDAGVKNPRAGLNADLQELFTRLLRHAAASVSAVLSRAIQESGAQPPASSLTLATVLATIQIPIQWVTKKMNDASERRLVQEIYNELQATGRVVESLPDENKVVRSQREQEKTTAAVPVTIPIPSANPIKTVSGKTSPRSPRFYLDLQDPVVDAPSIGPKTAAKFQQVGIRLVRDLLSHGAPDIAARMGKDCIPIADLNTWQLQAQLMCQVPGLRGHDVQMLVACGVTSASQLASAEPGQLHRQICRFAETPFARRLIRDASAPDLSEVQDWCSWARFTASAKAA